jgi:hypothetical protein
MRIGNRVLTFHRPEVQKEKFPGEKEAALAAMPRSRRPRAQAKPPIRVDVLSPYNRLPSTASVNRALSQCTEVRTPGAIVSQVAGALRAHVAANGALPDFLVLGDVHRTPAGLMMVLAALHEYRDAPGRKIFSTEIRPQAQERAQRWLDQRPRLLSHCVQNDLRLPFPGIAPHMTRMMTALMFAKDRGFELNGFDPMKHTAMDLEEREQAMLARLGSTAPAGALNVVFAGNAHVPKLLDTLSPMGVSTLAISLLPQSIKPGETETRNRMSYLLSSPPVLTRPAVHTIMPSPELRNGNLDAAQFIKRELTPWHPPLRT